MPAPRISIQPPRLQIGQPLPPQAKQLTSTSTLGSVNGKRLRPEPRPHSGPVQAAREFVEDVFQVGHRDALVHGEPFDLVEEVSVRGVHGVGPIDAAGRDDSYRRAPLLHHADLHRAGLAAQQDIVVEEERVEGIARRMVLRMLSASKL